MPPLYRGKNGDDVGAIENANSPAYALTTFAFFRMILRADGRFYGYGVGMQTPHGVGTQAHAYPQEIVQSGQTPVYRCAEAYAKIMRENGLNPIQGKSVLR